jgi:putative ABC transport system permease protein
MRLVPLMVRRSLRQHAMSTAITAVSGGLAAGLAMAVFAIHAQARDAFTGGQAGFDAVLGARGSALQLVLNTVFHLETSPGNIPWSLYEAVRQDPGVELAVPYAVGDNYRGFRVVGTTPQMFTDFQYRAGRRFELRAGGRPFDGSRREAVVGSEAARHTGLREGSRFSPYHGLVFDEAKRHAEEYVVTGVMESTNSPSDRVIWIPIEGVLRLSGHVLRGTGEAYAPRPGEPIPAESREVSAVMLKFRTPQTGFSLDQTINRQGKAATLAWPIGRVMAEVFEKVGWVSRVLELVAYLVLVVSAGTVLASVYNSMGERRRDLAILRAIGARRRTLFFAIICESAALSALGALAGYAVYIAILTAARASIRGQTGVVLDGLSPHWALLTVPLALMALGAAAGLLPAWRAYRVDVAQGLSPLS